MWCRAGWQRIPRFAFGVGKINSLAGFTSAVLLLGFALFMVIESIDRLINPLAISFDQALLVAIARTGGQWRQRLGTGVDPP